MVGTGLNFMYFLKKFVLDNKLFLGALNELVWLTRNTIAGKGTKPLSISQKITTHDGKLWLDHLVIEADLYYNYKRFQNTVYEIKTVKNMCKSENDW